jgi:chaperonin GroES
MSTNLKPLGDKVLIEISEAEAKTSGGIILPDNAKEKPQTGKIISVGAKVEFVKAGQVVVFDKWGGKEVKVNGKDYLIVAEKDLHAVYE